MWVTPDDLESMRWWSRYLVYPLTCIAAAALGNWHLVPHLMLGTLCRYAANLFVTFLSKLDTVAEPRRIHRANPPARQHLRELDWDGALLFSPAAFVLVDAVTPWLRADWVVPLDWSSLLACFVGHYLVVEPVYYVYHRWLHTPDVYRLSHAHHHSSIITEAVSGTSHPMLELLGYLANFSFPFLVPAWCGLFSYELIYVYFVWFDLMNCIGHCNFEAMPRILQWGPLKYLVYNSCFHSLHHSKFKYNYCLFCPLWDYLCGTAHPTSEALYAKVLSQPPRKLDAVFLGHGHFAYSMVHLPWLSPYLATHEHRLRWWMAPLQPLLALWAVVCRYCMPTACVQRYQFLGTQCATWCLPVTGHFFLMRSQKRAISDMIMKAVLDADGAGARYLGLGALNKAQWINHGGEDIVRQLPPGCSIKIVHGNTLTAAAVFQALLHHTQPSDEIFMTGSTSKIGRALCLLLARRGNVVRMLSSCDARFEEIRADAGPHADKLKRARAHSESTGCRAWVIGKQMSEAEILEHIPLGGVIVDYAVPHVPAHVAQRYCYINGAALSYDSRDCDLTFCHDVPGTMPACLAATIIHAREDSGRHECGEINENDVEEWWDKATRHGFRLECLSGCPKSPSSDSSRSPPRRKRSREEDEAAMQVEPAAEGVLRATRARTAAAGGRALD
uniref:Fatty acid hydroxylase domain-containing protein n=1 Tax=Alexandrium monilatum TaxID=311494 RepID=A0A6T1L6G4_9DINO